MSLIEFCSLVFGSISTAYTITEIPEVGFKHRSIACASILIPYFILCLSVMYKFFM